MKKLLMLFVLVTLVAGMISPAIGEHNEEFSENGCETADHTINVSAKGEELVFYIDGEENPDVQVDAGSCVKVIFKNESTLNHDFTVVDDVTDEDNPEELIHMDTAAGTTTEHLWLMPDRDVELQYFCEVPGHREGGMEGTFILGDGDSFLPGFGLAAAFLALSAMVAIPALRSRKQ